MSNHQLANGRPFVARTIHRLAVPIVLAWLAITVIVTIGLPPLEQVEKDSISVSETPKDAPSFKAMDRMIADFKQANSETVAMVVLEGQQPLNNDTHRYYDQLIRQLKDDPKHVQHIQDFWGDPLTAGAAQSGDGKAVYVQLDLAGHIGTALAHDSTQAVRDIVGRTQPPPGVKAYVTGPAAISTDMRSSGDSTVKRITTVSLLVIFVVLLLVYRSVFTVILLLLMVGIELMVARGFVAFLWPSRDYRSYNLCREYAGIHRDRGRNGLRNILRRPLSGGTSGRRRPGNGVLHDVPWSCQSRIGFRFDDRRSTFLPELYPAAQFPSHGRPLRCRRIRRGRGGSHSRAGSDCRRQPRWVVRPQAHDQSPWLAAGRYRDRPLARAHSGCDISNRAHRAINAAEL